jgi:hypothetical protein
MLRSALIAILGVAALLLDPIGAYSKGDFHYSDADMRKAVEGTWSLTFDGKTTTFTLAQATSAQRTSSAGLIRSAAACRTRSLIKSAEACIDMSKMPLEVHVVKGELAFERGVFAVLGATFESGQLDLYFSGGYVDARITKHGEVVEVDGASAGKPLSPQLVHL